MLHTAVARSHSAQILRSDGPPASALSALGNSRSGSPNGVRRAASSPVLEAPASTTTRASRLRGRSTCNARNARTSLFRCSQTPCRRPGRSGSPRRPELTHAPRTGRAREHRDDAFDPREPRRSRLGGTPAREQAGKRPAPTRFLPDSRCAGSIPCTAPQTMQGRPVTASRWVSVAATEALRWSGVRRSGLRARSCALRRSGFASSVFLL
jgi:hypothetical protein